MPEESEFSELSSISLNEVTEETEAPLEPAAPELSIQAAIKQARQYLEPIKTAEEPAPLFVREPPQGLLLNLPKQTVKRHTQAPFNFNMMVAGRAGLGKSTFLNMLFTQDLLNEVNKQSQGANDIDVSYFKLEENGVKANFTIIETSSYGDEIDSTNCSLSMVNYIDKQLMRYMYQEEQPDRSGMEDSRVHLCLYFIEPINRALHPIDLEAMKELGYRTNLVPVIAKADTLTTQELCAFKDRLSSELQCNRVKVYDNLQPFSVVCSNTLAFLDGRECFARVYSYGIINCENPAHSEFNALCTLLMETNTLDLIQSTQDLFYHYERMVLMLYRSKKIENKQAASESAASTIDDLKDPLELLKEIQKIRLCDLEKEHLQKDLLFLQQVRRIQLKYNSVGRYQSQRFSIIQKELQSTRLDSEQELKQARFDINELQERIVALRVRAK